MVTSGGKLEFVKRQRVGDESFASVKIDVNAINNEPRQIMMAKMSDGRDE